MAKLHRIHLVAVGHHEARFHPLALRFDHQGSPMDAVMNLRNGGGKTSLLSLIYAVLLPGKTDFLGRVNESNRMLNEYFTLGRLGVVALELSNHVGRFTLMLAWVRRDREEPPMLFSFLSGSQGIPFDELPLQGLVDSPLSSLGDLERWLRDRHARNPGNVDLTVAANYREWHTHLKKDRGVDPHLYRTHLAMNRSEGAVDEEFKFTKTNDFIRRYLEFAIEAPNMGREDEDPVTASLNEHRLSLTKLPHYRREIEFIADMLPALRDIAGFAGRRKAADQERTQALVELGRLADGIEFMAARFRREHQEHDAQHKLKKDDRDQFIAQRDNAKRYANGYDRLARELRIKEARVALEAAKLRAAGAATQAHEFACALLWREVRRAQAKLKALSDQRDQLRQELRPDREKVEQCALRLEAAFNDAIAAAELELEDAKGQATRNQASIADAEGQLARLKARHTKITQDLSAARTKIETATRIRDNLVDNRVLLPREDAADGEKRLSDEVVRYTAIAQTRRADATAAKNRAKAHRAEADRLNRLANEARSAAGRAAEKLQQFEAERDSCAALEPVRQVLEGGAFDPFNPGVVAAIRGRERALRQQTLTVGIERAEDRRLIERYDPHRHPLFPVARELEKLVASLRDQGVRGVMTGYEWLNANLPGEQAEARLRDDPAAFSGLVVNTAGDLDAVRKAGQRFALSRPVRITLSADLAAGTGREGVTILPQRLGLYSARAAVAELGQISDDQRRLQNQEEELAAAADSFAATAGQIEALQAAFPAAKVEECRRVRVENESLGREQSAAADSEKTAAAAADEEAQRAENEATGFEQRASAANLHLVQVRSYRSNFGNNLDGWLQQQNDRTGELATNERQQSEADATLRGLKAETPAIAERRERSNLSLYALRSQKTAAKLGAYLPAKPVSVAHSDIATEEAPFVIARDAYEAKAKGPLEGQIAAAEQVVADGEEAFSRNARGVRSEAVAGLSETPDLELQSDNAKQEEMNARTAESRAATAFEQAEAQKPKALGVNERADLDPALTEPPNFASAEARREEKLADYAELHRQAEALRDVVADFETKAREAKNNADHYRNMADLVAPARAEGAREHAALTGEPDGDRARIKGVKGRFEAAKDLAEEMSGKLEAVFEKRIDLLVKHEKWDSFTVEIRDKFRRFTRKDYEAAPEQLIHDCEERKSGLEDKIAEAEKLRDTLIDKLYDRANEAIRSLEHAGRLSRMPEGLGAWSGQQFVHVTVPPRGTQAERRVLLGRLMDSWMAPGRKEMSIPRGAALAFDCLLAVMNQREISVEILKPEAEFSACNYQPVTKLASFSGGQRVTAAILLYCVIVRVRSDHGDTLTDCGFLILDNPFGKASHFPLVDLQLKVARLIGVQLLYLTGINDFEALASFPLRLRLRNVPRKGGNGERLVQAENDGVEAVRLGENGTNGNGNTAGA